MRLRSHEAALKREMCDKREMCGKNIILYSTKDIAHQNFFNKRQTSILHADCLQVKISMFFYQKDQS